MTMFGRYHPSRLLRITAFALAAAVHAVHPAAAGQEEGAPASFASLLKEADLELRLPADFREIPPPGNDVYAFDKAWVSADGKIEIRLAVRPIARMVIEYDDPHSSAPDPDDIHSMAFTALIGQFARQGSMPARDIPHAQARRTFNADWAALATFGADPELNTRHAEAMLLALHRMRTADVYVLFLYDDPAAARERLKRLLKVVRFRHATSLEDLRRKREEAERARNAYLEEGAAAGAEGEQCVPPADARQVHRSGRDLDQRPER